VEIRLDFKMPYGANYILTTPYSIIISAGPNDAYINATTDLNANISLPTK